MKIENIVAFQSVESFENATGLDYYELSDEELFEALVEWYYPGEHEVSIHDERDINTNFLGYLYGDNFLLSHYERGLVIGLGKILNRE